MLPWYGSLEATDGPWPLSSPGVSATSPYLNGSSLSPGSQAFGYLMLALSSWTLVLASLHWVVVRRLTEEPASNLVMWLAAGVALSAGALLLGIILEAHARPPFGDGPPLALDWGATVGVIAAGVSLVGALCALTACALNRLSSAR